MKYVNKAYILLVLIGMVIANFGYAFIFSKDYASAVERSYFQAFLVGVLMIAPKDSCVEKEQNSDRTETVSREIL